MEWILKPIDIIRAQLLKFTMQFQVLQLIYKTRSLRLFYFFIFSYFLNFILAIKIPLWMLLLGPIILGIPHLVSSLRYIPRFTVNKELNKKAYFIIAAILLSIAALRLLIGDEISKDISLNYLNDYPNMIEIIGSFLFLGTFLFFLKTSKYKMGWSLSVLIVLSVFSYQFPALTLGFLVLIHNFVGFLFWIIRAKSKNDKTVAIVSLLLFSLGTALILTGTIDFLIRNRIDEILNGRFSYSSIGFQFSNQAHIIARAVTAYAFGQGVHYFIWLKAIPEQELPFEHTLSFQKSFQLLKTEMGSKIIYIASAFFVTIIIYGFLKNFIEARILYLSIAAFHGYLEIVSLPFVKKASL